MSIDQRDFPVSGAIATSRDPSGVSACTSPPDTTGAAPPEAPPDAFRFHRTEPSRGSSDTASAPGTVQFRLPAPYEQAGTAPEPSFRCQGWNVAGELTGAVRVPVPEPGSLPQRRGTVSAPPSARMPMRVTRVRGRGRGRFRGAGELGVSSRELAVVCSTGSRCAGMNACVSYRAEMCRSRAISSSGVGRSSGSFARQARTSGARSSGTPDTSGSSCTTWYATR